MFDKQSLSRFTIIEYNPQLADVTKTTRVAYVKFMSRAFKDGAGTKDNVSVVDEKAALSRSSSKAMIKFTSSVNALTAVTILYQHTIIYNIIVRINSLFSLFYKI